MLYIYLVLCSLSHASVVLLCFKAVGGNIMTASPISDLNPVFMAAGCKLTVMDKGNTHTHTHTHTHTRSHILLTDWISFVLKIL